MEKIKFIITDDKSIGLFNEEIGDIYHSQTGALKEAFDKFIIPSHVKSKLQRKEIINVLDICYGIGYNTKALLTCADNDFINIDCLEFDKKLAALSPFIKDEIFNNELKIYLLSEILNSSIELNDIYNSLEYEINCSGFKFFNPKLTALIKHIYDKKYNLLPNSLNYSNLHNIYYSYISNINKTAIKTNKYNNLKINFIFGDARKTIQETNRTYDVIFLDAFSPQKDPALWTVDFLNIIKSKMSKDSMLVTYSKSTPFRSALNKLGFYIGKTYINEIDMGTTASLNKENIESLLDDYDMSLLKTRAGICYKDANLNLPSDKIIKNRAEEIKKSTLLSHTKFLKQSIRISGSFEE